MSSPDDDSNNARDASKRKVQRACDVCRRRKVRCDGGQVPGSQCSTCVEYQLDCTYMEGSKKRHGPTKGYVESLENRLEKVEALLNKLHPNADFCKELGAPIETESWLHDGQARGNRQSISSMPGPSSMTLSDPTSPAAPRRDVDVDHLASDEEDDVQVDLVNHKMKKLFVGFRFFGKSSSGRLVQTAFDVKSDYIGKTTDELLFLAHGRRDEFWLSQPWEAMCLNNAELEGLYHYPPEDLLESLVDLYFQYSNLIYPLLHRPTFDKARAEGLHHKDEGFRGVLLLVCSIGSRWSNDTRVRLKETTVWSSAGWRYFRQVQLARTLFPIPPSLYDIQIFALGCLFLSGCSAPQLCWTLCGVGIRFAEDVGAHRRKVYSLTTPRLEGELWKRAFWVLVVIDRWMSTCLGRPCAVQDEDFDLDLPIDVDDEYWECPEPTLAWVQPPGKPSKVAYFIASIRLSQIVGFALRTIYSINKSKSLLGFGGAEWEQRIVAELDSTLNTWVDGVPGHLRWPPSPDEVVFFTQSAILYAQYYQLQIMVHRPFISTAKNPGHLSFPSLAICTNAARAISHIADATRRHRSGFALPDLQMPVFEAAIVLLLHIWGHRRAGLGPSGMDYTQEMQSVMKCMDVLRSTESRWHPSGRLWDVLYELASIGDFPTTKRESDSDGTRSTQSSSSSASLPSERVITGSSRVHALHPTSSQSRAQQAPPPEPFMFEHLPMNTDELGRMDAPRMWGGPISSVLPATDLSGSIGAAFNDGPLVEGFGFNDGSSTLGVEAAGIAGSSQLGMFDTLPADMPTGNGMSADIELDSIGMDAMGLDMWSNIPMGYGFNDWDSFFTNMLGQPPQLETQVQEPPVQVPFMPC
ncbi:hypothetical protein PENSPDRAFT_754999 [Peniophora sp. CONT]|nr:hypothetical protein PENSPDRAFT_754999 [Peniophora sp. CONT]